MSLGRCLLWLVSLPAPAPGVGDRGQSKQVKGQGQAAPPPQSLHCVLGTGLGTEEGTQGTAQSEDGGTAPALRA